MILDLIALDNSARVWIYQADRELSYDDLDVARDKIFSFLEQWTSHDNRLATYGNIFHRRFLALFVDESRAAKASGCSIDASVRFIKSLSEDLLVDFFDRLTYAYLDEDEEVRTVKHADLSTAYNDQIITDDTIVFDNLVKDKGEFLQAWTKPLKASWMSRML